MHSSFTCLIANIAAFCTSTEDVSPALLLSREAKAWRALCVAARYSPFLGSTGQDSDGVGTVNIKRRALREGREEGRKEGRQEEREEGSEA